MSATEEERFARESEQLRKDSHQPAHTSPFTGQSSKTQPHVSSQTKAGSGQSRKQEDPGNKKTPPQEMLKLHHWLYAAAFYLSAILMYRCKTLWDAYSELSKWRLSLPFSILDILMISKSDTQQPNFYVIVDDSFKGDAASFKSELKERIKKAYSTASAIEVPVLPMLISTLFYSACFYQVSYTPHVGKVIGKTEHLR